eukprot:620799-Rhodomonas_salina.4
MDPDTMMKYRPQDLPRRSLRAVDKTPHCLCGLVPHVAQKVHRRLELEYRVARQESGGWRGVAKRRERR